MTTLKTALKTILQRAYSILIYGLALAIGAGGVLVVVRTAKAFGAF